jgi:hypothetical protein
VRLQIFREALEYFSKNDAVEKCKYPIAHGTGSWALEKIINTGIIKMGGDGLGGEGSIKYDTVSGGYISVAEMEHNMSDPTMMFYARKAANEEVTKKELLINADIIDDVTVMDDFIESTVASTSDDELINIIAKKYKKNADLVLLEIANETGTDKSDIDRIDILHSSLLTDLIMSSLENEKERKHYPTAESEEMAHKATLHIVDACRRGEFPKFSYDGKEYDDPEDVINIDDRKISSHSMVGKIIAGLRYQYEYYLEEQDPPFTIDELRGAKKQEVLEGMAEYLTSKESKFAKTLHVLETDSEETKSKKEFLLKELGSQFPSVLILEGEEYKNKGLTHMQQTGKRLFDWFPVEERILVDMKSTDIREIIVPRAKMEEVESWLEKSGIEKDSMPKMVAFEYFEVKRLLNHQLKGII